MKGHHRMRKGICVLAVYAIFNMGVLSFLEVQSASGSKLQQAAPVMAEVRTEESSLAIAVLGNCLTIDFAGMPAQEVGALVLSAINPVLTGAAAIYALLT